MKVIFLDIDGVLNCRKTPNPRKFPYIVDEQLLARYHAVLRRTGARTVLASTWRYDPVGCFAAKHHGVPFIDVTPDLPKQPRSKEVVEWLRQHPEVTRYAVLDDDNDGLDSLPLFQPSPRTGLSDAIAAGLADYLDGKTDRDMRRGPVVRLMQNVRSVFTRHQG
jgi:hypothetical protein